MLISLVTGLFLFLEKVFSVCGNFPLVKSALSVFRQEGFSFPDLALRESHFFLLKMLLNATTAVTLPVFAVLIAISSAFAVLLGAVAVTFIGRASVDK